MNTEEKIKHAIRDVKDFPKPGIVFKDITPIFQDPSLVDEIVDYFVQQIEPMNIDAIACIEARGFLFGAIISNKMNLPFVPIRKAGKLPYESIGHDYELEYGTASIEMHEDAVEPGWNVLVHDDLLATGGTALAAASLINKKASVAGFSFLVELGFLDGKEKLASFNKPVTSLVTY